MEFQEALLSFRERPDCLIGLNAHGTRQHHETPCVDNFALRRIQLRRLGMQPCFDQSTPAMTDATILNKVRGGPAVFGFEIPLNQSETSSPL